CGNSGGGASQNQLPSPPEGRRPSVEDLSSSALDAARLDPDRAAEQAVNLSASESRDGPLEVIELQCAVQHYAWGDRQFIPALLGSPNPDGKPFAELWMGAHPDAPSSAQLNGRSIPLDQLIQNYPARILHPRVAERFNEQLPFLFKVLAAE